jgi:hypothetical protein
VVKQAERSPAAGEIHNFLTRVPRHDSHKVRLHTLRHPHSTIYDIKQAKATFVGIQLPQKTPLGLYHDCEAVFATLALNRAFITPSAIPLTKDPED